MKSQLIKAVVSDLDGTLINHEKLLDNTNRFYTPQKNIQIINIIQNMGIHFSIATGRSLASIAKIKPLPELQDTPIVTLNGAQIIHPLSKTIIKEWLLPQDISTQIINFAEQKDILLFAISHQGLLFHNNKSNINIDYHKILAEGIAQQTNLNHYIRQNNIYKLYIIDEDTKYLHKIKELVQPIIKNHATMILSSEQSLEFINPETSKGNALKYLTKYWNITNSQVIAFGDSQNDETMLDNAGIAVITENASPYLKTKSPPYIITKSNTECGVAHFLKSYFSIKENL